MSMAALCIATRNLLRENLGGFYTSKEMREANCRVMPDEKPAPNCGEEFISIYGSHHRPRAHHLLSAIEEEFGVTVAITRRVRVIPTDQRGETGWIHDRDPYYRYWKSLEARAREIVGLVDKNYQLLVNANKLFSANFGFSEPLVWQGNDPAPVELKADHFHSLGEEVPFGTEGDPTYGFLLRVYFSGAIRYQPNNIYDRYLRSYS